jgi:hypothetical protein
MQSDKHFKSNLEPIYKVIDTVYTNDFVLDSNAYIVYMGADLSQLLGISNPVGKSFFEVFKSEKILDVSFFNDDFLASPGRDIL